MFSKVVEEGLTYGQAMDKCIHEEKKVSRAHWGGYWFVAESTYCGERVDEKTGLCCQHKMNPMIVACLKDNGGYVPAIAYNEDKFAKDWRVVE